MKKFFKTFMQTIACALTECSHNVGLLLVTFTLSFVNGYSHRYYEDVLSIYSDVIRNYSDDHPESDMDAYIRAYEVKDLEKHMFAY